MKLIQNTPPALFSSLVTCLGQCDWCGPSCESETGAQLGPLTISLAGIEPAFLCGLPISPQRLPVCNLDDYFMHVNHIWHTTNLARL